MRRKSLKLLNSALNFWIFLPTWESIRIENSKKGVPRMETGSLRRNAQYLGRILLAALLFYLATYPVSANASSFLIGNQTQINLQPDLNITELQKANTIIKILAPELLSERFPRATQISSDETLTTVRFDNFKNGIKVLNDMSFVHFGNKSKKEVERLGCAQNLFENPVATVSPEEAKSIATEALDSKNIKKEDIRAINLSYNCSKDKKTNQLVYKIYFQPEDLTDSTNVLINAHTGAFESSWLEINPKMNRRISELVQIDPKDRYKKLKNRFNSNFTYKVLLSDEEKQLKSQDQAALDVHTSLEKIYSYFKKNFSRDSYDDRGSRIDGIVHFGKSLNNAFFHPGYMALFFGDGDGVNFNSFTSSTDVIAHEFTHMMVYKTSGLRGAAEAGSLNESISDFFGARISNITDWKIGRQIFKRQSPLAYVRDMKFPEDKGKPGHYADRRFASAKHCNKSNDNCGAHVNAGIPNKATVAMAEILGAKATEKIFYHAVNHYYFKTMGFKDAKKALKKSCKKLFGNSSTDCGAVDKAWESVGVN
jgi:Zn-dependent metalloprotease